MSFNKFDIEAQPNPAIAGTAVDERANGRRRCTTAKKIVSILLVAALAFLGIFMLMGIQTLAGEAAVQTDADAAVQEPRTLLDLLPEDYDVAHDDGTADDLASHRRALTVAKVGTAFQGNAPSKMDNKNEGPRKGHFGWGVEIPEAYGGGVFKAELGGAQACCASTDYDTVAVWSEWAGAKAAIANNEPVVVPCGTHIEIDTAEIPPLAGLRVEGKLSVRDAPGLAITLNTDFVYNCGELEAHLDQTQLTVMLTGHTPLTVDGRAYSTQAFVTYGGMTSLKGAMCDKATWTLLAATADAGATALHLDGDAAAHWPVGTELMVASTDYAATQTEVATVARVTNGGRTVELTAPLAYPHAGVAPITAEVAALSRNIKITSEASCAAIPNAEADDKPMCGHFVIDHTPRGTVCGVEVTNMGKHTTTGRYPLHTHMCGDAPEIQIRSNAVHSNHHRAVVIHGTSYATYAENVLFRTQGHLMLTEDGAEEGNRIVRNIFALPRPPVPGWAGQCGDTPKVYNDDGFLLGTCENHRCSHGTGIYEKACGNRHDDATDAIWISNPANYIAYNRAIVGRDVDAAFRFETRGMTGSALQLKNSVRTHLTRLGKSQGRNDNGIHGQIGGFIGNVAHSSAKGVKNYPFWSPLDGVRIEDFTAWKNHVGVFAKTFSTYNNPNLLDVSDPAERAYLVVNATLLMNTVAVNTIHDASHLHVVDSVIAPHLPATMEASRDAAAHGGACAAMHATTGAAPCAFKGQWVWQDAVEGADGTVAKPFGDWYAVNRLGKVYRSSLAAGRRNFCQTPPIKSTMKNGEVDTAYPFPARHDHTKCIAATGVAPSLFPIVSAPGFFASPYENNMFRGFFEGKHYVGPQWSITADEKTISGMRANGFFKWEDVKRAGVLPNGVGADGDDYSYTRTKVMRAADYLALGAGAFYKENGDWDRATYSPLAGTQAHFGTVNKGYIHYGHHKRYRDAIVFPTRAEVDAAERADVAATCRAADGNAWHLLFRQSFGGSHHTAFGFSPADDWAQAKRHNAANPEAEQFSVLDTLERYRAGDDKLTLKMMYPESDDVAGDTRIWRQASNPVAEMASKCAEGVVVGQKTSNYEGWTSDCGVDGFEPIFPNRWRAKRTGESNGRQFGGLEYNGKHTFLDGTVRNPHSDYMIGRAKYVMKGVTGKTATRVELYACGPVTAAPTPAPTPAPTVFVCDDACQAEREAYENSFSDAEKRAGGRWTPVFRQTMPFVFSSDNDWAEARSLNADDNTRDNYSILSELESFRSETDGKLQLKLEYPGSKFAAANVWKQTSNPVEATAVAGYEAVDVANTRRWSGLQLTGTQHVFLDGDATRGSWYSVGTKTTFRGKGYLGAVSLAKKVELSAWEAFTGAAPEENTNEDKDEDEEGNDGEVDTATDGGDTATDGGDADGEMEDEEAKEYDTLVDGGATTGGEWTEEEKAAGGRWKLVFRQTYPFVFSKANNWAEARSLNADDNTSDNYSILSELESFRKEDGTLKFSLEFPGSKNAAANVWKQTSNPVEATTGGVEGYEAVDVPNTGARWGGLEKNGKATFLDGSKGRSWWYAVGAARQFKRGYPGAASIAQAVELRAWECFMHGDGGAAYESS